ncbi:MAG: uracil-DNA glycosylase [Coriobacteriia bacterium]|nr:uracil-DNA glycosylase [Coriobacteriia bacterium]
MSARKANADPAVVADKLSRVHTGRTRTINVLVDSLRAQQPGAFIPYVDPDLGGADARVLMLFQDPGDKTMPPDGSGLLSVSNNDRSASRLCEVLDQAGIPWSELTAWNAIPWYTGGSNSPEDKKAGLLILIHLTRLLPELEIVVTFGNVATKSWHDAMRLTPELDRYRHIASRHPSPLGQTRGGRLILEESMRQVRTLLT